MKDSLGHILYVGKSKNLKNRVQSYFQNANTHSPKTKKLVNHLKDFDLILTDTEFEALMLECQFIQELKPLYNRKMKSPLAYTYIVIREHEGLRRMEITNRRVEGDANLYFGPFTSRNTAERAVEGLKECFQIGCNNPSARNTACLNHSLGSCLGMCLGGEALEKYNRIMDQITAMLHGSDLSLLEQLQKSMSEASENLDFEAAAKYRNCIETVSSILSKEKVIEFAEANPNIAIVEFLSADTFKLFLIKRNVILYNEKFSLKGVEKDQLVVQMKTAILDCFKSQAIPFPQEVSKYEIDTAQIIYSYLKGSSSRSILIPDHWFEPESHSLIEAALHDLLHEDN